VPYILDIDGVICRGSKPIVEGIKAVKLLIDRGEKFVFVSNNSTRSRRMLLERFRSFGLDVSEDKIVVATYATSIYLKKRYGKLKIFTTGEKGLIDELKLAGHEIVDYDDAECLVVASNRNLDYNLMTKALRCCMKADIYVATNPDKIFPGWDGPIPGTGMIIGALYWMTSRMPDAIVGKPSEIIMNEALSKLKCKNAVVVGDQIDVDVVAGKKIGCKTALVLTGVTTRDNLKKMIEKYGKPDYIADNLFQLVKNL